MSVTAHHLLIHTNTWGSDKMLTTLLLLWMIMLTYFLFNCLILSSFYSLPAVLSMDGWSGFHATNHFYILRSVLLLLQLSRLIKRFSFWKASWLLVALTSEARLEWRWFTALRCDTLVRRWTPSFTASSTSAVKVVLVILRWNIVLLTTWPSTHQIHTFMVGFNFENSDKVTRWIILIFIKVIIIVILKLLLNLHQLSWWWLQHKLLRGIL